MKRKLKSTMLIALICLTTFVSCKKDDEEKQINITAITLNQTTVQIKEKQTVQLQATVQPNNATNKKIIWETSDETVATVDKKGMVTAINFGDAIITASTIDKSILATCHIDVRFKTSGKFPDSQKVFVEGGTFQMGSNDGDSTEKPVHRVTIKDFFIGKYEVTYAQYTQFLNAEGNRKNKYGKTWYLDSGDYPITSSNGVFTVKAGKEDYPVRGICLSGMLAYCKWIGARIPTEAEWEYAAKGGKKSKGYLYSGSNNINEVAWYSQNSTNPDNELFLGKGTHKVGTKKPNELGIYDMSGNMAEVVSDSKHENYIDAPTDGSSWGKGYDISRGGAWGNAAKHCRTTAKNVSAVHGMYGYSSFRVAFDKK